MLTCMCNLSSSVCQFLTFSAMQLLLFIGNIIAIFSCYGKTQDHMQWIMEDRILMIQKYQLVFLWSPVMIHSLKAITQCNSDSIKACITTSNVIIIVQNSTFSQANFVNLALYNYIYMLLYIIFYVKKTWLCKVWWLQSMFTQ